LYNPFFVLSYNCYKIQKLRGQLHVSANGVAYVKKSVRKGILPLWVNLFLYCSLVVGALEVVAMMVLLLITSTGCWRRSWTRASWWRTPWRPTRQTRSVPTHQPQLKPGFIHFVLVK